MSPVILKLLKPKYATIAELITATYAKISGVPRMVSNCVSMVKSNAI
jgi:hypothetical protein